MKERPVQLGMWLLSLLVLPLLGYSVIGSISPPPAHALEACLPQPTPTGEPGEPHPLRPNPGQVCTPAVAPEARLSCGTDVVVIKKIDLPRAPIIGPGDPDCDPPIAVPGETVTCKRKDVSVSNVPVSIDLTGIALPIAGVASNTAVADTISESMKMRNYTSWYLQGAIEQADQEPLDPAGVAAATTPPPASCKTIGANSAAYFNQVGSPSGFYSRAGRNGMGWTLEIAKKDEFDTALQGVNTALIAGMTPIVRIGVKDAPPDPSFGFTDPDDYIDFLNALAASAIAPFYAIAGPNEPDGEHWLGCADNQPVCIGQTTAAYMNAVVAAKASGTLSSEVKLLSPAFNVGSHTFDPIMDAMVAAGANFSGLDGIAANAYNVPSGTISAWVTKLTNRSEFGGKPIVLTETGKISGALDELGAEIEALKSNSRVAGALLFNVFDTNSDPAFTQFVLNDQDLTTVLGAECTAAASTDRWFDFAGPLKKLLPPNVLDQRREDLIDAALAGTSYNQVIGYVKGGNVIGRKEAHVLLKNPATRNQVEKVRLTHMTDHRKPPYIEGDADALKWYTLWRQVPFVQTVDLAGEVFATVGSSDETVKEASLVINSSIGLDDLRVGLPHLAEDNQLAELAQAVFRPEGVDGVNPDHDDATIVTGNAPNVPANYFSSVDRANPWPNARSYCVPHNLQTPWNPGDELGTTTVITGNFSFKKDIEYSYREPTLAELAGQPRPTTEEVEVSAPVSLFARTPKQLHDLYDRLVGGPGGIYRALYPLTESLNDWPAAAGFSAECGPECEVKAGNEEGRDFHLFFPHLGSILTNFHQDIQCMLDPLGRCERWAPAGP